jgi:NhaP-type Na+/H+ and K+/H+ antiporter
MLFEQFVFIGIIILIGVIVLSLRRKAEGSRTGYKLVLVLLGLLLGLLTISNTFFSLDKYFLKSFCVFLLIILLFELSVRLNSDNITLSFGNVVMFFVILIINILAIGIASTFLLHIQFMHGVILAIILSSIEYFLVDQLKSEGDFANPLILFFAFSILVFYALEGDVFSNVIYFIKYLLIGLGTGVLIGIIVFRCLKNQQITPVNELGMVAVAVITYIVTEQLSGSGLFSVMVLGTFFGNSYVRKTSNMYNFSPFIFKTLEMLIYLMIGFVVVLNFTSGVWWKSLVLFGIYLLLRFIILAVYYKHYSFSNKLLLTLAPKGMIMGVTILVLGVYGTIENVLLITMTLVLIYSLFLGTVVEYIEQQKVLRLDKVFKTITTSRFGRKRSIFKNHKRVHK